MPLVHQFSKRDAILQLPVQPFYQQQLHQLAHFHSRDKLINSSDLKLEFLNFWLNVSLIHIFLSKKRCLSLNKYLFVGFSLQQREMISTFQLPIISRRDYTCLILDKMILLVPFILRLLIKFLLLFQQS